MVIPVIDEVKNSDSSTDVNDSIEDVNDFLVTASAATTVNSVELSSAEIADREIKIWKTRTVPFPKDKNPLDEWHRGAVHLYSWLGVFRLTSDQAIHIFFLGKTKTEGTSAEIASKYGI